MTDVPTNEQYGAKFLREGIASRVRRLRDLTDRIEREAEQNLVRAEAGSGTYGRVGADVVHEITWGLANLDLVGLITTATEADVAHTKGD